MKLLLSGLSLLMSVTTFAGTVNFFNGQTGLAEPTKSGTVSRYEIRPNLNAHALFIQSDKGAYCRIPAEYARGLDLISLGRVLLETNAVLKCWLVDTETSREVLLESSH